MSTLETMAIRNVKQNFGPRDTREDLGGNVTPGIIHVARWEFNYDQLPVAGLSNLEQVIPAGSSIMSAKLIVKTAFAGGTSLTVGLRQKDGTVINDTGLVTAANAPLASLTPAGKVIVGTGALVNTTIGVNPGELQVTAAGTFTAGRAEILVEYKLA